MRAGPMQNRVRFERRPTDDDDGYGNELDANWTEIPNGTVSASFKPEFGSERLEGGRLESTMRGRLMVRRSPTIDGITAADRVVFVAGSYSGKECEIRSIVPTMNRRSVEMVIEEGVAT